MIQLTRFETSLDDHITLANSPSIKSWVHLHRHSIQDALVKPRHLPDRVDGAVDLELDDDTESHRAGLSALD